MAQEPSTKRQCGDISNENTEVDDVQVLGQKLDYTKRLNEVDIHGKENMDAVYMSNPYVADEMINRMRMRIGGQIPRYIGVDVEPKGFHPLLQEEKLYTFVGFSIEGDKRVLKESCLEINPNKYINMQRKWRVPFVGGKRSHSLDDVAGSRIHPFYKLMKYKINREEYHKLRGISPLPYYLIEYAAIDAYAMYESWNIIASVAERLECSKGKETDAKEDFDHSYYYGGF
ncbi:hypothetical protein D1007_17111 [Hordeum vulgare]|nr:hypothetical protein D1007_17111 [Hordeum vulgare]